MKETTGKQSKRTPRCCASVCVCVCVKSPRTKNEPHRVTRCKSRSPDLGNRIPITSRRKKLSGPPRKRPQHQAAIASDPAIERPHHPTTQVQRDTPSKARTHIFVHDGLSLGGRMLPWFARQRRTKRCSGGTGQAGRQTEERRRAEISRVVLLWRRLSAFSFWRTKRRLSGDFLPKHDG